MYETKMVKFYLPNVQLCIFSLIINLLVVGIQTPSAIAEKSTPQSERKQAANKVRTALEPEILSEINRVRTNPKGYAKWLEGQRKYYDGIWLKLPGEKPIRTNKGIKALEEAIAVLKEQQPLSPLANSQRTATAATTKLENFATAHNIQHISYGRITAKGIVMSLVVDELFPDRRRRNNLLSPDAANTGVVCKSDPRYAKVCAIAYADSGVDLAEAEPITPPTPETVTTATKPETKESSTPPEDSQAASVRPPSKETDTDIVAETLPQPPQPQAPPNPVAIPEPTQTNSEAKESRSEEDIEIAQGDIEKQPEEIVQDEEVEEVIVDEDNQDAQASLEAEELEDKELEEDNLDKENSEELANAEIEVVDDQAEEIETEESADSQEEESVEVLEAEADNSTVQVANNSNSSRLLENVERGSLEKGDRTIAEDGSFYDSYPLESKEGDSFIIYLESDEFDAFVALIDDKGNIIKQNDDISEENSNSRIRVNIPEDGVYNVIVNAYDEGGKGKYILTVRR